MYDVVISGGGPAGAISAYECARHGLRTALLEKGTIPRRKCCAGGLLRRAAISLPFDIPDSVVQREIKGFAVELGDYRKEFDFPKGAGYVLRREIFDFFLIKMAQDAGAEVMQNHRTMHVDEAKDKVVVRSNEGDIEGRLLIVAEGATGSTARALLGPYPKESLAMGRAVYVITERDPGDRVELHLMGTPTSRFSPRRDFPLNGWMFPHGRGANIGVVGTRAGKEMLESALSNIRLKVEDRYGPITDEENLGTHPLPFTPRRLLHSKRAMVVGDAAGLVNPISGEGMSYAIISGRLAARTAAEVIKGEMGLEHLAEYDSRCASSIIRDIKAAAFLSPFLHRIIGVADACRLFDNFHEEEALVQVCLGIARGENDWRSLLLRTIPRFPRLFFSSLG